jgi:putative sterol carrier protein
MQIDAGAVSLALEGEADEAHGGTGASPDVTIVLTYDDAAAMSRGELSPAEVLTTGRIRVRGDLAALAASQRILNEVRNGAGGPLPATTY